MHEFELSSKEGVVLMCLAEALLRVPDSKTIDKLIRDKLSAADWEAHLGHSDSHVCECLYLGIDADRPCGEDQTGRRQRLLWPISADGSKKWGTGYSQGCEAGDENSGGASLSWGAALKKRWTGL